MAGEEPGCGLTALSAGKPREAYAVAKVVEGPPPARSHLPSSCQAGAGTRAPLSPTPLHGCLQRGGLGTAVEGWKPLLPLLPLSM